MEMSVPGGILRKKSGKRPETMLPSAVSNISFDQKSRNNKFQSNSAMLNNSFDNVSLPSLAPHQLRQDNSGSTSMLPSHRVHTVNEQQIGQSPRGFNHNKMTMKSRKSSNYSRNSF